MKHVLNLLVGVADAFNPLGTAPRYSYPAPGDRAADMRAIRGDFATLVRDLKKKTGQALEEADGEVNHRTNAGQGQARHRRVA